MPFMEEMKENEGGTVAAHAGGGREGALQLGALCIITIIINGFTGCGDISPNRNPRARRLYPGR